MQIKVRIEVGEYGNLILVERVVNVPQPPTPSFGEPGYGEMVTETQPWDTISDELAALANLTTADALERTRDARDKDRRLRSQVNQAKAAESKTAVDF